MLTQMHAHIAYDMHETETYMVSACHTNLSHLALLYDTHSLQVR